METAPTSIEVLLRPTLVLSDEPSDLRGSLSPTTQHDIAARTFSTWWVTAWHTPGVCQTVTHPILDRGRRCLTSVIEPTPS